MFQKSWVFVKLYVNTNQKKNVILWVNYSDFYNDMKIFNVKGIIIYFKMKKIGYKILCFK